MKVYTYGLFQLKLKSVFLDAAFLMFEIMQTSGSERMPTDQKRMKYVSSLKLFDGEGNEKEK